MRASFLIVKTLKCHFIFFNTISFSCRSWKIWFSKGIPCVSKMILQWWMNFGCYICENKNILRLTIAKGEIEKKIINNFILKINAWRFSGWDIFFLCFHFATDFRGEVQWFNIKLMSFSFEPIGWSWGHSWDGDVHCWNFFNSHETSIFFKRFGDRAIGAIEWIEG